MEVWNFSRCKLYFAFVVVWYILHVIIFIIKYLKWTSFWTCFFGDMVRFICVCCIASHRRLGRVASCYRHQSQPADPNRNINILQLCPPPPRLICEYWGVMFGFQNICSGCTIAIAVGYIRTLYSYFEWEYLNIYLYPKRYISDRSFLGTGPENSGFWVYFPDFDPSTFFITD